MKRAEVAKLPRSEQAPGEVWYFDVFDQPVEPELAGYPLADRPDFCGLDSIAGDRLPTHEAALRAALAEVGLAAPVQHREAP